MIAKDKVQTVNVEIDVTGEHKNDINVTVTTTAPGEWTLFVAIPFPPTGEC